MLRMTHQSHQARMYLSRAVPGQPSSYRPLEALGLMTSPSQQRYALEPALQELLRCVDNGISGAEYLVENPNK